MSEYKYTIEELKAENERIRSERDEWERKSKNNGLAAALALGRMQELETDNEKLRAALLEVEWVTSETGDYFYCPWCGGKWKHATDCQRQAALRIEVTP